MNTFSAANWKALPVSQKKQHTLSNCGGYQVYYFAVHTLFANVQGVVGNSGLKVQSKLKGNSHEICCQTHLFQTEWSV